MSHDLILLFLLVALVFFAAGAVKGVLGMGLPTVAMGLLGLMMPVSAAAAVLTLPSFVTNAWQAWAGPGLRRTVRRLWALQLGIAGGTVAAAGLLPATSDALGRNLLGACLMAYGAVGLKGWRVPSVPGTLEQVAGLVAGLLTGVLTGLTGVFVLPAVPFIQSLGLPKDELTQALGVCFTTSTLTLAASLAANGHLDAQASLASAAMVIPALAGMWAGQIVRNVLGEAQFRCCLFAGLLLLGSWLLLGRG